MNIERTLGKYKLIERLGRGGMAEVYKALQPGLNRFVAVKILHRHLSAEPNFIERFQREAQVIGRLQHSNILPLIDFDFDPEHDEYYMVTDYIQGGTLEEYIKKHAPLPLIEALSLVEELADATAYAHQNGMIHRDIKPANIMFMDQSSLHPLLTDFGLVRIMDEALTLSEAIVGTPAYMSPEAVRSEPLDERADVYSLGVVLYELLTARTPYIAKKPYEMMLKLLHDPIPSPKKFNADIPQSVEELLFKVLSKDKEVRFESAQAFRQALQEILQQLTGHTRIPHRRSFAASVKAVLENKQPTSHNKRLPLVGAAMAGVLLVIFLMVGIVLFLAPQKEEPSAQQADIIENEEGQNLKELVEPISGSNSDSPTPVGSLNLTENAVSLELKAAPPPADSHYELWVSDDKEIWRNLGALVVENGEEVFTASSDEPLIGYVNLVQISIEPDNDPHPTEISEQIAFRGELSPAITTSLRQLMASAETVDNKAFLFGAQEQAVLALEYGHFLEESLAAGEPLNQAKQHAEGIINILDGKEGILFGDYDHDGLTQNPGDDFGVRAYLSGAKAQAQQVLQNASDSERSYAQELISRCDNALIIMDETITQAQKIVVSDSSEKAVPIAKELITYLEDLLEKNKGAYEIGLQMGQINLVPAESEKAIH